MKASKILFEIKNGTARASKLSIQRLLMYWNEIG